MAVRAGRSAAEFNQAIDGAISKLEGFARDAPDARLAVEQETAVQLLRATDGMFHTDVLAAAGPAPVRGSREYASQIGTYHANLEAAGGKLSAYGTELYTELIGSESWIRVTAVEYALVTGGTPPIADADWRAAARDVGDRLSALYVRQTYIFHSARRRQWTAHADWGTRRGGGDFDLGRVGVRPGYAADRAVAGAGVAGAGEAAFVTDRAVVDRGSAGHSHHASRAGRASPAVTFHTILGRKDYAVGPHARLRRYGKMAEMSSTTDLRGYLRTLDAETPIELFHAQGSRDPELRRALELKAGTQGGDVAEAHRLLDTAAVGGSFEYATKVGSVLDTLQRLLDAGSRADLAPLARRTVDDISRVLEQIDDYSGVVYDELERAVDPYARACVAHPPDVNGLADFAQALGDKGIARIKFTVDKMIADGVDDHRLATAERLREDIAEISGDGDALVAILSAKPPRLDISLKIVRVLRGAGRHAEAIAHAAKALAHDKGPARAPVVDELAGAY